MMLELGDTLEIGGRECTICYKAVYNNTNYVCVAFENQTLEYDLYKYKYDNEKLMVSKVENLNEMTEVMKLFVNEGIDEYGIPEELEHIISKIQDKTE